MSDCFIKICGVKSPVIANNAALAGADFIGIVFDTSSPRYVSLEEAKEVSKATKEAGAIPVAVFVNQSLEEILHICLEAEIESVQLHGPKVRAIHHLLPAHFQRIYVLPISENGILPLDSGVETLDKTRDFILIDSATPGHGKQAPLHNFHFPYPLPWMLAGGLNANNVTSLLQTFKPQGVDVSSGVESSRGNKDYALIHQFIEIVRGNTHGK